MEEILHEEWRPVTMFPEITGYEVSNLGRVRSPEKRVAFGIGNRISPSKILTPRDNGHGYLSFNFKDGEKQRTAYLHRLVALAFIGEPPAGKPEVNHKDGNKSNNLPSNLEYVSRKENAIYAVRLGLFKPKFPPAKHGAEHHAAKLTDDEVRQIRQLYSEGTLTQDRIAAKFGVHQGTIWRVVRMKTRQHISQES